MSGLSDPRVRLALWGAGIAAVLCLIGWFMGGPPAKPSSTLPPDPFTEPAKSMVYLRDAARQSGGNWDRVSRMDQMLMNKITQGHGREFLAKTVRELNTAPSPASSPGAVSAP